MKSLRFGTPDGEKLVILPGLSLKSVLASADAIRAAYAAAAAVYDITLFDPIENEPEGYRIEDMAADTLAAMNRLGLRRVSLMGVSMGGMVAQALALQAPERVSSLVLCSTAMRITEQARTVFSEWRALAASQNAAALAESFGSTVYSPAFYAQYREPILASCCGATERDFHNFAISVEAMQRFDVSDRVGHISCPAFVIGAGEDRVFGVDASRALADALHCPLRIYEGFGHAVYDEAPGYLDCVLSFLTR